MPAFLNMAQQFKPPPKGLNAKVPYPGIPPAWMQPASGPEIQGREPPMQMPASATAPPPPPNPSLIPQAPQVGPPPTPPPSQPMRLGLPGDQGPKLSNPPPGMGDPFQGASDEQLQQLMELGIIPDQQAMMQDQISQAEALRGRPMPEGRDSGRVYTAANPLEFLGAGLQSWAAHRDLKGGKALRGGKFVDQPGLYDQQQGLLDKQAAGRKTYFDLVRGR